MRAPVILSLAAALGLAAVTVADNRQSGPSWSYDGPNGPDVWGSLSPDFITCATGMQQSPIDLTAAVPASVTPPDIAWNRLTSAKVAQTDHTIEVDLKGGGGIVVGNTPYELIKLHVRHASEHTVRGRSFPLEVQLEHRSEAGERAVIAVLFGEGEANPVLDAIFRAAPAKRGALPMNEPIDLDDLLPEHPSAFHYAGSLTTPPCTENVTWTVFESPMTASAAQIDAFASLFPANNRPIQERARRFVLKTN